MSFKKKLKDKNFRMLILGSTGSGKSYFLTKKLLPLLADRYDEFVIFTRNFNETYFLKQFKDNMKGHIPHIFTSIPDILEIIEDITELQYKNIKGHNKEGVPIFKTDILFIFDDVIKEKLFKDDEFLEIFLNLRHLQISTILLSQISNCAINTKMKGNTQFVVSFRLNNAIQRRYSKSLLEDCVSTKYKKMKIKDVKEHADKLYQKNVVEKQYGYIITDELSNYYL